MFDLERVGDDIDPAVQAAADKLHKAYDGLQRAQDPLVKGIEKQNVLEVLEKAVVTTIASEAKHSIRLKGFTPN